MIASAVIMAVGAIYQGMAQSAQAKSQANLAEYNAQVAENDAKAVEQRSLVASRRQAEASARKMSAMEAKFGAAGAVSTEGSPLKIIETQASEFEKENLMIGYEGQTGASRLRSQAAGQKAQADIYSQKGKSAMTAGMIGAGSSLMSGFSGSSTFGGEGPGVMSKTAWVGDWSKKTNG